MTERDYSNVEGDYNDLPSDIKLILESNIDVYILEDLEDSACQLRKVKSPFILADNDFDLREANNTLEEYNVDRVEQGTFTGGGFYNVYTTTSTGVIVHGNEEEGYNIFVIN